ncbi:hypothetical protein GQ600_7414 [Phytophthora cactorum]|nr:hypothetical protein GQ600_7414 [Phytophthora cactorum]
MEKRQGTRRIHGKRPAVSCPLLSGRRRTLPLHHVVDKEAEHPDTERAQRLQIEFQTDVANGGDCAAISAGPATDVLCNVGLLWISSSVFQMARGSIIIFSAFFSVRLMGKKLYGYHYASIWIVMLAVALVGYAGTMPTRLSGLGLFFIIAAQILCALQIVVEEHMMLALNVSPMLLVGFEGLWGLVFYIVLVPILTLSPATGSAFATTWHEDFVDSFVQVKNSPALIVLILAYIVAVGTLNVTGNYVTKHLSAVMRSITEEGEAQCHGHLHLQTPNQGLAKGQSVVSSPVCGSTHVAVPCERTAYSVFMIAVLKVPETSMATADNAPSRWRGSSILSGGKQLGNHWAEKGHERALLLAEESANEETSNFNLLDSGANVHSKICRAMSSRHPTAYYVSLAPVLKSRRGRQI